MSKNENGFDNPGLSFSLGMWHWHRGEADAAFAALDDAISRYLSDPALVTRFAVAGLLDDERGRALLERHFEHINRERGKLDLKAVSIPDYP